MNLVYPAPRERGKAYGHDVTPEGLRCCFPADVDLSGVTYPLGRAIAEAIRDRGLIIMDTAGAAALYIEDMRTLGSPYHQQGAGAINPFNLDWTNIQAGTDPRWGAGPRRCRAATRRSHESRVSVTRSFVDAA